MSSSNILIIAEAGVNHNGDIVLARQLIDAAAEAGADFVKFQTFKADRLVTINATLADYQAKATENIQTQYPMLRRLELSEQMHLDLIAHCAGCGIDFLSTGFDIESVNFLADLGQNIIKIPSGEITNLPYLRHIGQLRKEIVLSTGMATLGEIEAVLDVLEIAGTCHEKITVLHCTTEYPTPMEEVNLRAMQTLREAFGVRVGYSDHTQGIEVAIAAAALGASVIEKHFTMDRNLPGPDHRASLEPNELKAMVAAVRNIEKALGGGVKRPTPSEEKNRGVARKSIVARCVIRAGERFCNENLAAKRPGTGVSPMRWDEIVGKIATRDYLPDELIEP
jgi:N,N'-diacetyllegionaminate synthase